MGFDCTALALNSCWMTFLIWLCLIHSACVGGYGYFVKYKGKSGFTHLMAHLQEDSIKVKPGQKVKQKDVLGIMGTTGNSTGVHLHWEVRWGIKPTDPMKWLVKVNS